ncbi:MFS transporter [Paenibacillus sp. LHD-117]|uniref:MFS transporter n=1 Tax=Paenibacillus sp. LHD-117 TaxID=3071412 RepID=UPI0027E0163F|nr:MFS transporter [Paenibacillus sp. LHD-117]MDQ6420416.1 MFS transporter [Paenibacillus sp. LHD-117]
MERLWTRPFILYTVGMLFLFTGFYLLLPTMPLFIKQLGGNEAQVGLATGAFMLAAVVVRPIVGGLLDRYGRRPFIVWGLLLFALAMYLYDWVGGIVVLLMLRILHGMTWAVSTTAVFTAVTDMIPSSRRGEGMGWFGTAMTLAMAIGPMLGIWVMQNLSFGALFLIACSLSAAALFLTFGVKLPFRPQTGNRKIEFFEKSVWPVAASVFLLMIAYGGTTTFVPLFSQSIGVNSGLFFLVYAVTLTLIRPVAGKLSDRRGETFVIIPGLAITIAALLLLSLATGWAGVLAAAVLFGVGFGSAQPALQVATLRLARPDRRGVANASLLTATDLGIGLGAIALGWVSQFGSYQVLFTVSAVSAFLSLMLFVLVVKRLLIKIRVEGVEINHV